MQNMSKRKRNNEIHRKSLEIPTKLYDKIFKEAQRRSKPGDRVSEHSIIIETLNEKFLPTRKSLTHETE